MFLTKASYVTKVRCCAKPTVGGGAATLSITTHACTPNQSKSICSSMAALFMRMGATESE